MPKLFSGILETQRLGEYRSQHLAATAMNNETLVTLVCHNACCGISAMHELGIGPDLAQASYSCRQPRYWRGFLVHGYNSRMKNWLLASLLISLIAGCGTNGTNAPNPQEAPVTLERMEFDEDAEEFIADIMREIYNKSPLTEREATVYHVSWMMTEVNNGGFHQFFHNMTGDHAEDTVLLLRRIGATETAKLVEQGCKKFPGGKPPEDYRKRRATLDRFTPEQLKELEDLQEKFYARREDLCVMLKKHWDSAPEK